MNHHLGNSLPKQYSTDMYICGVTLALHYVFGATALLGPPTPQSSPRLMYSPALQS
ncbi:hypothetical protein CY34DRAFT_811996 [Suillus luteus UH-Slu-Lm8-n1]|uniref:Uncharacterized protein n=1 Tax=Suillus luteus UH-Slu-Lm8-n1 TaxID=930992 RepID=A0A0D0AC16_9AGAM|nr:hypothetical protein CY34DRAFT_811996 [Suillus luteus UH-Slu-Lm8-n1]